MRQLTEHILEHWPQLLQIIKFKFSHTTHLILNYNFRSLFGSAVGCLHEVFKSGHGEEWIFGRKLKTLTDNSITNINKTDHRGSRVVSTVKPRSPSDGPYFLGKFLQTEHSHGEAKIKAPPVA
jgi:hypothetical protein